MIEDVKERRKRDHKAISVSIKVLRKLENLRESKRKVLGLGEKFSWNNFFAMLTADHAVIEFSTRR